MEQVAFGLAYLAIGGALLSWIAGAWFFMETLLAVSQTRERGIVLRALVAWPFVRGRLKGAAAAHAAKVNKAIVAFIVCLMIAAAAFSVAINLTRVSRQAAYG